MSFLLPDSSVFETLQVDLSSYNLALPKLAKIIYQNEM